MPILSGPIDNRGCIYILTHFPRERLGTEDDYLFSSRFKNQRVNIKKRHQCYFLFHLMLLKHSVIVTCVTNVLSILVTGQ